MDNEKLYLCKADCSILGTIGGIKTETCSLKRNATDLWEMTFEIDRFVEKEGKLIQSDYYDSVDDMMRIYLDSEEIQAYFVIDSEPTISGDGIQEIKTVTCHSIECELSNVYLKNLKINCGTLDSQEYLIKYPEDNPRVVVDEEGNIVLDVYGNPITTTDNINPYTGLPFEYISLVNYERPELSLMHIVLDGTGWTLKDDIPQEVCSIKKSFDTSDSVYAFLMKTISPATSTIFDFDRKHKQIGIVKVENYGKDTGVFITMRNLMNSFEVTSSLEENIITKLVPTGANDLGILYVNFGEDYIINLDYFMNTLNEYGDYKFVSKDLHDKYIAWKNYRYVEQPYIGSTLTRREMYTSLSKEYNKTILNISELKNRVPNDGAVIDYSKFSLEELKTALNAYNKALVSLITVYKEEYGVTEIGSSPNYIPTPSTATSIKDTPYWYDFYAYQEKIIPQVTEELKMYCKTDTNGNLMVDDNGKYIELEYGNRDYYANKEIVKRIDDYLYEWSLYGLDELEAKKKAWEESASLLFKDFYIKSGTVDNPTYITVNDWDSLTDSQKAEFTSKDAFTGQLNTYLDYMSLDNTRQNGITGKVGKGIIRQCEDAIAERKQQISVIEKMQKEFQQQRKELSDSVAMKNFFTDDDLLIIKGMLRQQDYNNENILTTNLNDIASNKSTDVTVVDKQEELYQDALIKLEEISQPQYSFATELDNLYSLEEFMSYREPFDVGNFIRVGLEIHEDLYENDYIKLRLMAITHNPMQISEELSVEFSTMTKTLNTISDLAFLFDKESSSGSSSSSSSSSSSGGTYGNNDANVQISNNMLNALLKTEMFGTTVTDVILDSIKANKGNFGKLFAHSGVFDSLEAGQIKVSGDCLFDHVKSSNYVKNSSGSYLNLFDGSFEFAGGKLTWNGNKLSVTGDIIANSLKLGSDSVIDGLSSSDLSDANNIIFKDLDIGSQSSNHNTNYTKISKNGLLEADNAIIHGTIFATNGEFSGTLKACDGSFTGSINVNNKFIVDSDGSVVAKDANISGDVTAETLTANKNGSIAGWNFNSTAFYKNDINIGGANGFYIGEDGISIGSNFIATPSGFLSKSTDYAESNYIPRYFKNNYYNYPYKEEDLIFGGGDHIASYIIFFENNYSGKAYVRFKNPNSYYVDEDGDGELDQGYIYDTDTIYEYNVSNGKLILTVSHWFARNMWRDYILGLHPLETNPSIAYRDVNEVWSNVGITKVEIYTAGGGDGSVFVKMLHQNTPIHMLSEGLKIDTANSNIMSKNYLLDNNGITFYKNDEITLSLDSLSQVRESTVSLNSKGLFASATDFDDNNNLVSFDYIKLDTSLINAGIEFSNDTTQSYFGVNGIKNTYLTSTTITSGSALRINSDGYIWKYSSSSERYKDNMTTDISEDLNPHKLYDVNIYDFKYKKDYLSPTDQRYDKNVIGFKAEDVYEKYPIACNLDEDGLPEVPEYNILIAPMLKLIQEQHEDIENLKEKVKTLEETLTNSEVSA